jgi:predicted dehydrogenase
MSTTRRVAVIGARGVGVSHVAALRELPDVQVNLIVGSSAETAQAAARSLRVAQWSADWSSAVGDKGLCAIHICTPNNLHFPIAAAALAAGKHVICEKPLTANVSDAVKLVDLARQHNHQLTVLGYKYRYAPLVQVLRQHIELGKLGRIHEIRGSYLQNWMLDPDQSAWRRDAELGGNNRVLLDIGTHLLDLMETVLGQRLLTIQGQLFSADSAFDTAAAQLESADALNDGAHLLLRFEDGARGLAALSQVSAAHTHQINITVDGSAGSAHWILSDIESLTISDASDNTRLRLDGNTSQATAGRYWRQATDPDRLLVPLLANTYAQLNEAAAPAAEGCAIPTPTFADGLRHIQLIHTL